MWSKCSDANLHMTFVICVSDANFFSLPLLVLPRKRLNRDVIKG